MSGNAEGNEQQVVGEFFVQKLKQRIALIASHWLFVYVGSVSYFALIAIVNTDGATEKSMQQKLFKSEIGFG